MNRNLCKTVIAGGGKLTPLIIPAADSKGLGLMNPTILVEQTRILLNLRNINYTLYHCEGQQLFTSRWGPLSYLHPENDMHLRTYNYMCELDPDTLEIKEHWLTDTKDFDNYEPLWDFVGLEDARLVRWNGKLYQCGVRRDTTTNGVGRMEVCEIAENENPKEGESKWKEVSRARIEPPADPNSYCEKNWVPVLDMPMHFIKWSNPTEVVKVDRETGTSKTVYLSPSHIPDVPDFRGGSQVINYKGFRLTLAHEVNLFRNKLSQKDATYTHRFIIWDQNWNIVKLSDSFSFMDGEIEFSCGIALYRKDLLLTFGFQDNAAYILRVPEKMIDEIVGFKKRQFNWGPIEDDTWFKEVLTKEIFVNDTYQKFFKVEENDTVLDVGASIGPFAYSIINKKPKHIFCLEPSKELFPTLYKNTKSSDAVICINKGIGNANETKILPSMYKKNEAAMFSSTETADVITFKSFLDRYNISKIDFLKTDCEGAEYDIFNQENYEWINKNVKKIAGEFHLSTPELKEKFKLFRKLYMPVDKLHNVKVFAMDGTDIIWGLWDDYFIPTYEEIMIYIDNREIFIPVEEKPSFQVPIKSFGKPIEKNIKKWKTTNWPTFEITTNILSKGCVIQCAFCPQTTLVNNYSGMQMLSLENFKKAISTIPKEITIIFSGFSEPFLNKSCADMILYAHEKGHAISLFTTGVGMSIEDFDKIKHIPFSGGPEDPNIGNMGVPINNGGFTLHLPDAEGYAKHPITSKYIKLLEHISAHKDVLSKLRVNCMGSIHEKIFHIFQTAEPIDKWSRANNLIKEEIVRPEIKELISGKYRTAYHGETPLTCRCDEKLYHQTMLPNGDVVLCCMDYSLEHILGNLFEQEYEDIIPEPETAFNLCRFCENGIQPQ